jgi:hypothetical protein
MVFAADYPVLYVLWTMIIFFCWVAWTRLLIRNFSDLLRRDVCGWAKAASAAGSDSHVRSIVTSRAGRAATEIQRARQLFDAATRREFHQLKAKALARASIMTEIAGTA